MNEYTNIQSYYGSLNKLRKFFKIKDDSNHSDSNTDANSDNSFDSTSEKGTNKNSKLKKTSNKADNITIKNSFLNGDLKNSM